MSGSFQLWVDTVRGITGPTEELSMLDLCCGEMSATRLIKWKTVSAVDVVDYPNRPREYIFWKQDVLDPLMSADGFDVCICSDGLEHFTREQGYRLLVNMERWAKLPIVFTPTGQPESELEPNSTHPDAHKSSWLPAHFIGIGWHTKLFPDWHPTIGLGGLFAWKPKS